MLNFFYQVGYSGMAIMILGLGAVYMALRGIVQSALIKKQAALKHSIIRTIAAKARARSGGHSENFITALMQVEMKGIFSAMYFLKLCAAIGPLLGLLGTVLGMVDMFSSLSSRASADPTLLAGGIWQALLTTVMGLTLAIPALIVHYYLLLNLRFLRTRITLLAEE